MEFKQLTYFLAVADCLSFSRAAEKLYISQPALSYQIAELERELGAELFVRSRRSVSLTWIGQRLVEPARQVMDGVIEIHKLARWRTDDSGFLQRIVIYFESDSLYMEHTDIPRAIGAFIGRRRDVDFGLRQDSFAACLEHLQKNEDSDLAILTLHHNETLPAGLEAQTLLDDRFVLVAAAAPELEDADSPDAVLHRCELIQINSMPRASTRILKYVRDRGLDPTIHPVTGLAEAFSYMYARRSALIVPRHYLLARPGPNWKLVELPGEPMVLRCAAVWNSNRNKPLLDALLDALRLS